MALAEWVASKSKTGLWCDKCTEVQSSLKKVPPCEQCFPGIHIDNEEAWQLYGIAAKDPMGVSPTTVIALMNLYEISNPKEVIVKVLAIAQEVGRLRDDSTERDHGPDGR